MDVTNDQKTRTDLQKSEKPTTTLTISRTYYSNPGDPGDTRGPKRPKRIPKYFLLNTDSCSTKNKPNKAEPQTGGAKVWGYGQIVPPIQYAHKAHTGPQAAQKGNIWENSERKYWRCQNIHLVKLKSPGQNSNHAGNRRYLREEDMPHQPTQRRAALKNAR